MAEMPIEIEGYYRRALDYAWLNEGVPSDPARLAVIIGKGCTPEAARWVLTMFEPDKKDASKSRNSRQEFERKKQCENSKKRKEAGRLSGVKRREKRDLTNEQNPNKHPNKNEHSDSDSDSNEKKKKRKSAAHRIPDQFEVSESDLQWAAEHVPLISINRETEKFLDYWIAEAGPRAEKMNWTAAWRTWMRRADEYRVQHDQKAGKPTNLDRIASTRNVINEYPTEAELQQQSRGSNSPETVWRGTGQIAEAAL